MLLALLAAVTAVTTVAAAPAQAAGYRYWSFWDLTDGTWTYANQGPSIARPGDGDVQGFRFAVSENSQDAAKPRGPHDFGAICGATDARDGSKRVALVVDFGTRADATGGENPPAPRTACARVAEDATSAEALASVAEPLRYDSNALLCAIDGYPRTGCGEQVSGDTPETSGDTGTASGGAADADSGGPSAGVYAGIAAVVLLAAAAVWQSRRRR
ncbi:SCO2322 family protein [Streptomyces uncialis]|uniref:SCO2322 family protein n=1 Tax=Streptomyces uncialis TaxID=1048205 RepID=UPI0038661DEF|nr:SCO2322 family protein [Streptomyces uncialis]